MLQRYTTLRRYSILTACIASLLAVTTITYAQTNTTWTGSGADANWGTAANWNNGAPTTSGTWALTFSGSTRLTNTLNTGNGTTVTLSSLTFSNTDANVFTLNRAGTETLTLAAGATVSSASGGSAGIRDTINIPLVLSGNVTFNTAGHNIQVTASPTGSGTITKSGGSTLFFNNNVANNIVGNAGTIYFIGGASSGAITLNGANFVGAPGSYSSSFSLLQNANIRSWGGATSTFTAPTFNTASAATANVTLTLGSATGATPDEIQGTIQDNTSKTVGLDINSGTTGSTWKLSGANTFSGNTKISFGTLALGNNLALQNSALDTSGAGIMTVTGFTTPTLGGLTGSTNLSSVITTGYSSVTSLTLNTVTGANLTYSGNITDGAAGMTLTKTGAGTQTLSGTNSFSGGLTLQGTGAINLSHSNAAGTGTISLKSTTSGTGTTLGLSGGITVANAISIDSTTGRENITSTGTGNNSLTGGITITGAGNNAILFANNQSSGNLTVSNGISGASYANQLSLRGSQSGNVGFLNGAVTLASNALFDNNGATSWTLNTAGSTWGQTYVRSSGNLILGANNALATGARVVFDQATSTGGVDLNGYNQTVAGVETTVTPTSGNGGRITNGGSSDSVLTLAGLSADRTFAGTITDGATNKTSLVMNSASRTQTLTGASTFSGTTTISAGTLSLGNALALQNSTLDTTASAAGTSTTGLKTTVTALTFGGLSGNKDLAAIFTTTSGGYSGVTALTLNPGTGVTNTYSGVIANGASGMTLTKSGNGTQVLSGANTYTGTTTVTAGALQVGSGGSGQTGSGAVTAQTGSTILGTGVVRGNTFDLQNGSTLRPGDSVADSSHGTLTFTPVTASGSTSNLQGSIILGISTPTTTDATFGGNAIGSAGYNAWVDAVTGVGSHDRLVFTNPTSGTGYNLNFLTTTGSLQVASSGFTPQMGQIFNLLDWTTLVTPNFSGFSFNSGYLTGNGDEGADLDLPDLTSSGLRWDFSRFTISGNIVVVPEPSRALLLMLGLAGLTTRRRRSSAAAAAGAAA